jgi:integrase
MWKKVEKNIIQRGECSFLVRIMVNGKRVDETLDSLEDARVYRDKHLHSAALDVHSADIIESRIKKAISKSYTFGDAIADYRPISEKKKGSIQEGSNLDLLSRLPVASKPMYMIHKDDLLKMFADIRSGKYRKIRESIKKSKTIEPSSEATARRYANLARAIFEIAVTEWKKIERNPFDELSKNERPKDGKPRDRRFRGNEYELIKKELAGDAGVALIVLVETAMRRGELLSLEWGRLKINGDSGSVRLPDSKNNEGRTVPLSDVVVGALKSLGVKKEGKIFDTLTAAALNHKWKAARMAIGSPDLRLHDLRHEGTSRLFEDKDLNVIEAAAITGHKTLSMLGRYANLNVDKLAKKLNASPAIPVELFQKNSLYVELIQLEELRQKGILTQTEFEVQKRKMLATM